MTAILAFDTSTQSTSVALRVDGQVYTDFKDTPRQHSDYILPMIDGLIHQANIQGADITTIAITNGPGSFMGTRLSVGVAQGLGYAWACDVCLVSSLQCLAQTAYESQGLDKVVAAWDARMGEVYWGVYALQAGLMQPVSEDQLSKPDAVPAQPDSTLVGNIDILNFKNHQPVTLQASVLLPFAYKAVTENTLLSPLEIEPVYLRASVIRK